MRKIDLGVGPRPPHDGLSIPSFHKQNRVVSSFTSTGAASQVIFNPQGAVTVQWIIAVTSAACTIQQLLNGQPYGAPLPVNAGAIIRFAGTFLANNEQLGFSVSAATTLSYEVVWLKEFYREYTVTETAVISAGTTSALTSVNLAQQNGVALSSPLADAPLGTEIAPVSRPILRKKTTIETTTPLAAGATFTGAWHDSELDGTVFVTATSLSNQAAAGTANAFRIEESDDINNAGLTRIASGSSGNPAVGANTIGRAYAFIKARFYRVVYVNGATLQGTFELTTCATNIAPFADSGQYAGSNGLATVPVTASIYLNNPQAAADAQTNSIFTATGFSGSAIPMVYGGWFFNGSTWDRPRTPVIFKQASTAATGSTALWTPTSGKKFRIMRYRVIVTGLAKAAAAADLKIDLLDSAASIGLASFVTIQTTAFTLDGNASDSGWIDLGNGILSALANNVLNLNLSFALTGGQVSVNVCGTEE